VSSFRMGSLALRRSCLSAVVAMVLVPGWATGQTGDPVADLKAFQTQVRSAQGRFTQTVTAADGGRKKTSFGEFAFQRPNRFRFTYVQPFAQTIVGDGQKVWLHDPDLAQVSVKSMGKAVGETPAALLAGVSLEQDFDLQALPVADGLNWVKATPKKAEAAIREMRVGLKGGDLLALEVLDGFGQRSVLKFSDLKRNPTLAAETFQFRVPAGTDVVEAP
jgi:outer membrane lipoprotein carrier protein